ncbi:Serine/threonine-protein phosphatase 6 regulatory subunit 3-B [Bienertia sinuspersici]
MMLSPDCRVIAVLLKAGNQVAEEELVNSGTIKRVLISFLSKYPYNNALHHHVESIISSCLESRNDSVVDHLFKVCDLIRKILDADKHPVLSADLKLWTSQGSGGVKNPYRGRRGFGDGADSAKIRTGDPLVGWIRLMLAEDGKLEGGGRIGTAKGQNCRPKLFNLLITKIKRLKKEKIERGEILG